jgi:hypothetical protein
MLGGTGTVPPASVPLGFLAAAGVGLWCTGALATVNLAGGPRAAARAHRTATPEVPARTALISPRRIT